MVRHSVLQQDMSNFSNDMSKEIASVLQRTPLVIRPSKVKVDIDADTTDADNLPPPLQPIIMSSSPACSQIREIVSVNFTTDPSKVLQELGKEPKATADKEDATKGGAFVEGDNVMSSEPDNNSFAEAKPVDGRVAVEESGNENLPDFAAEELASDIVPCMADADENASRMDVAELANKNVLNANSISENESDLVNENMTRVESANDVIAAETL